VYRSYQPFVLVQFVENSAHARCLTPNPFDSRTVMYLSRGRPSCLFSSNVFPIISFPIQLIYMVCCMSLQLSAPAALRWTLVWISLTSILTDPHALHNAEELALAGLSTARSHLPGISPIKASTEFSSSSGLTIPASSFPSPSLLCSHTSSLQSSK
jgi:hypothetical protein